MELRQNNIHDKDTRKNDTRLKNEKHDTKHDDTKPNDICDCDLVSQIRPLCSVSSLCFMSL